MAGDTTRALRTVVIPSFIAVCGFVILFMKKKRRSTKASTNSVAVDHSGICDISVTSKSNCEITINQKAETMVVPSPSPPSSSCVLTHQNSSGKMLLKEKVSRSSNACMQTNVSDSRSSETSTIESKASENSSTCEIQAGTEGKTVTNGLSHSNSDKVDKIVTDSSKLKEDVSRSESCCNGVNTDLINGMHAINLENTESVDIKVIDASVKNKQNSATVCNGSSQIKVNGTAPLFEESAVQTDAELTTIENGFQKDFVSCDVMAMSELSCETNFMPKVSTPDSGVSGELHESDAASSSMSEPSSECALNGLGDMLKSPVTSVSSDSGKDGSQIDHYEIDQIVPDVRFAPVPDEYSVQVYEFEIPQELCGCLIGKNGRFVKFIKEESNAEIYVKRHPMLPQLKTCAVSGTQEEIEIALAVIRDRFPVDAYPDLTLEPINLFQPECALPVTLKLTLPEGVNFDAILSATVTPGYFFLQQPTHPTYHTLPILTSGMSTWYNEFEAPKLLRVTLDAIVAVPFDRMWYRAQVSALHPENQQCTVRFLDYGGYGNYDVTQLRQIKFEFAQVPFQATECYLGSVTYPEGEEGWSPEAKTKFEELAQGRIIQGYIVGYDPYEVPFVHLYISEGSSLTFINRELVNAGFARWTTQEEIENTMTQFY